jgi:hypothetical protein
MTTYSSAEVGFDTPSVGVVAMKVGRMYME